MHTVKSIPSETELQQEVCRIKLLPLLLKNPERIWKIINTQVSSVDELAGLVRFDPVLAATVLQFANSVSARFNESMTTVREAIEFLGFERAKNQCITYLLREVFSAKNKLDLARKEAFWTHSIVTAKIASEITRKKRWISSKEAYLLGLVHDLGKVAVAACFPETYRATAESVQAYGPFSYLIEREYGISHTLVGKWIFVKWKLPLVFQTVSEFHHDPEKSRLHRPQTKIIHLADLLAHSEENPAVLHDERALAHCRALYITRNEWDWLNKRSKEIITETKQIWHLAM